MVFTPTPGYTPTKKAKSDDPFVINFENITPAYAAWVLAERNAQGLSYGPLRHQGNRKASPGRVSRYATEMEQGWWTTTHQGIAFDEEGLLIDGQNRLMGVVQSGVTVTMLVSRGVPRETFYLLDQGMARSAHQFLGGTHGSLRAALARTLMRLTEQKGKVTSTIGAGQYPSYRILHFLDDNPHVAEFGEKYAPLANRVTARKAGTYLASTSAAGILLGGFTLGDTTLAERWFDELDRLRRESLADTSVEYIAKDSPLRHFQSSPVADGNMTNINYRRALLVADLYRRRKPARKSGTQIRKFTVDYINKPYSKSGGGAEGMKIDLDALKIVPDALSVHH